MWWASVFPSLVLLSYNKGEFRLLFFNKTHNLTHYQTPSHKGAVKHRETHSNINLDELLSKLDHPLEVIILSQIKLPDCKRVTQRLDWKWFLSSFTQGGQRGVVIIFERYAGGQTLPSGSHNRSAAPACLYKDAVAACEKHFCCLAGSVTHPS